MKTSYIATQLEERQMVRLQRLERKLATTNYDQTPWGLLYRALEQGMGIEPKNFQLIYPFVPWTWGVEDAGYIGTAQYDFCSTIPQWSAVGAYVSSGDRFHQSYKEFLNVIDPDTSDPDLRTKIDDARDDLTSAANNYNNTLSKAENAYQQSVPDNQPSFTEWLGTMAGVSWQIKIESGLKELQAAQNVLDSLVGQTHTPGLDEAIEQVNNTEFYSKLDNPQLQNFPQVPNYQVSINSRKWLDNVQAGSGPGSATISFSNRDTQYDFSQTWAKASASIKQLFWSVKVDGQWQSVQEFETDNSLSVSLNFTAVDQISIQPSDWYNGRFLRSKANGPFIRGYSAYGDDGTQAIFGQTGFVNLLKTSMWVCYKPSFSISVSESTYNFFSDKFKICTGIRIGPFNFDAEGGSTKAGWTTNSETRSFEGVSTSEVPLIFGCTIDVLPNQAETPVGYEKEDGISLGRCFEDPDCQGNVRGNNVSKNDCFQYLQGRSWKKNDSTRCWEN